MEKGNVKIVSSKYTWGRNKDFIEKKREDSWLSLK